MSVPEELSSIIEGEVEYSDDILERYSRDASIFKILPNAVVYPSSVSDISKLVRYAREKNGSVSLTVRSGGTCMSGGPLTESVVVDVNRHLNRILSVQQDSAVTEPGAYYREFEKKTLEHNLLMPSYPASRDICTVGGMVNNNAGGEKSLAYGKTSEYVTQIKAVLADGNEYTLRALSKSELEEKIHEDTFEGKLYRETYQLIDSNSNVIQQAKPRVSKNSTGYALWDLWDRRRFDLTKLFCGSQGTLGITTQITFRLIHQKPYSSMLVLFLRDVADLAKIINLVLKYEPESFESYDNKTLSLALKFFPLILKKMGTGNALRLALNFAPEVRLMVSGGIPKLVLLAEFTGHDQGEVFKRARACEEAVRPYASNTRIAKTREEMSKYWTIRRESFNLLREHVKDKHTAPFIDDLIVQPHKLPEFLPKLNDILEKYSMEYTVAGHIGDGNFHIIPLMNLANEDQRRIIPELSQKVYALVFKYGGSMSGEHNDGLIRGPYLKQMYGEKIVDLFKQIKRIFDPDNIFNPGKKMDASLDYALAHIIRE